MKPDPSLRHDVTALFERFVAAMGEPSGGATLYDLYTPDAVLLVAGTPTPRQAITREAYAASHRAATEALAGRGFPTAGRPTFASWAPDTGHPERGIAWLEQPDERRGKPVRVAIGVVKGTDGLRVDWAALVPQTGPASYAKGRALALAEFPFIQKAPARGWLDVAYARHYEGTDVPLHFLPDARFGCHSSGACCRATWEVTVPASAQAFIDAIPWAEVAPELAGTQLEHKPDGQLVVKGRDEACRFLDENARCRIHEHFGGPVFTPCVVFPYRFTETPDGVAVTTRHFCGSARAGLGPTLESQSNEIQRRFAQAGPMVWLERPRLRLADEPDWEAFKAAEADLRAALRLPLPLHRRLWIGARTLQARLDGLPVEPERFALEPLIALAPEERQVADTYLPYMVGVLAMLHPDFAPANANRTEGLRLANEGRVAAWFESVLFAKDLSNAFGLAGAFSLLVLIYLFLLSLAHARGGRDLDEEELAALYTAIDHGMLIPPLRQLFELVPALRDNLDQPAGAMLFLRLLQERSRLAAVR